MGWRAKRLMPRRNGPDGSCATGSGRRHARPIERRHPASGVRALQQVPVEKRALVGGYRVHGNQVEAEAGDRRLEPDFARIEPVLQFAAVEHQLEGADPQAQRQEPEEIERFAMHVAGLAHENQDAQRAQRADRQVDVEDPAPAVLIGQPAAERRPHDRPADRAHAEHCHGTAVALRRVDLQQRRLRQRDQTGPGHPLQRAEENQLAEAIWSSEADRLPWTCGRATLRIELSTPCMMFAIMIEIVIMLRLGTGTNVSPLTAEAPGEASNRTAAPHPLPASTPISSRLARRRSLVGLRMSMIDTVSLPAAWRTVLPVSSKETVAS